jgi:hypothetical protein
MHGNEWSHFFATGSLDEVPRTSWQVQKQRPGYIWRSCKRLENTQIRVPLCDELREQTPLALILFVSSDAHDWPGLYLQYKIALSTDSH